jgi:DNA-directed RNA polymerase III subunit RPC3
VALPASVVKAGLAVLIQQGLVLHHTVKKGEGTSYEANWLAAYCLLRSGKILHLATEQLGINAGIVMDELLAQGHVRIKDLRNLFLQRLGAQESISVDEQSIEINSSSSRPSQPSNGAGEEDEISKIHYLENGERILDSTLQSLYLEGYLDRIGITDFIPSTDLLEEAEAEVARMDYPKTSKSATQEKIEAQILVESQVRTWKIQKSETLGLQRRGIKRDREEDEQVVRSKKLKTKTEPKAEESTVWQSKYTDSALAENDRVFKVRQYLHLDGVDLI